MTSTSTLSVVIVNWNTRDLLAGCLESVARSQESGVSSREPEGLIPDPCSLSPEVLIVDNASTDGSATMVRERFPWVRLIESQENLGFAAGNNLALRQATGKNLLLLNPDTVVTEGALDLLLHVIETSPGAAIVGAQLLNADGTLQMSCGVYPSLWTELPLIKRLRRPGRQTSPILAFDGGVATQSVDWVSGACLLIRRATYETIGPLDESFWLYTEETDWCYRARRAGGDVLLVPDARVYHLARAASGQRYVFTMLHFYQSKVRFARKHYGPAHASALKQVLRVKAAIWRWRPGGSPLRGAYPNLSDEQIRAAYQILERALALPLADYLAANWL